MDEDTRRKTVARLRRAAGQVEGITRMVEQERACADVLMQIAAARAALGRAATMVLDAHIQQMVDQRVAPSDGAAREQTRAELLELFSRYCAS